MAHLVQKCPTDAPELNTAVQFWRALLDANRDVVPVDVLRCAERWAFVTGLPDTVWAPLMLRTLTLTNGASDYAMEVADRCETVPIPEGSTKSSCCSTVEANFGNDTTSPKWPSARYAP